MKVHRDLVKFKVKNTPVELKTTVEKRGVEEGLLSTVNNEIDCSRSALGLSAGEYVTEFRLAFQEDVQPGFHDLIGPKAEVRVRETVKDGQKFVNKVDVGGLYGGEWVYDTDGWTTVTFNKPKGKLPKTGW